MPPPPEELRRLVRKHVNRLHHRKENSLLSNAPDLATRLTSKGRPAPRLETLPAPEPVQHLLHKETIADLEDLRDQFSAFLLLAK